jgi:hypothetical protein
MGDCVIKQMYVKTKINNEVWVTSPDNTNVAEAAHVLSNRRGKNLKLVTAIIQYEIYIYKYLFF